MATVAKIFILNKTRVESYTCVRQAFRNIVEIYVTKYGKTRSTSKELFLCVS